MAKFISDFPDVGDGLDYWERQPKPYQKYCSLLGNNPLLGAGGAAVAAGGYSVDNSVRLNDNDDAFTHRTPGDTATDATEGTISLWFKLGHTQVTLGALYIARSGAAGTSDAAYVNADGGIDVQHDDAGVDYRSTQLLRDPTSWYHLVVSWDYNDDTASNRLNVYLNGVIISDWDTETHASGTGSKWGTAVKHRVGMWSTDTTLNFDGYISQFCYLDGKCIQTGDVALTDFGEFDNEGEWRPVDLTGLDYTGNHAFLLDFSDSAWFGKDANSTGTPIMSTSAEWTDSSGTYAFTNGGINPGTADDSIKSVDTFTGDFEVSWQYTTKGNWVFGVYEIDEDGTFDANSSTAGLSSMTDSFWLKASSVAAYNDVMYGNSEVANTVNITNGDVFKIKRVGSDIEIFKNGASLHDWTQTTSNEVRIACGQGDDSSQIEMCQWVDNGTLGNDFFDTGLAANDQVTDTPTDNFCTGNSLWTDSTYANGNLDITGGTNSIETGTFVMSSGKWAWEVTLTGGASTNFFIGIAGPTMPKDNGGSQTGFTDGIMLENDDQHLWVDGADQGSWASATFTTSDVMRMELDVDAGELEFFKNDSSIGKYTSVDTTKSYRPCAGWATASNMTWDFGASGALTDTPSTGFNVPSTANLTALTFDPADHHGEEIMVHNGTTGSITLPSEAGVDDDYLVIVKDIDNIEGWRVINTLRGLDKMIAWDGTAAEDTDPTIASTAGSSVLTFGAYFSSSNYSVEWFKAGTVSGRTSHSADAPPSLASTSSVNKTSGFGIMTFTGNDTLGATVAHGMGTKPDLSIVRTVATGHNTRVASQHIGDGTHYLNVDADHARAPSADAWDDAPMTDTLITVGTSALSTNVEDVMVVFSWYNVPGFSNIGVVEGNNDPDGVVINTGVNPRTYITKQIDASNSWGKFTKSVEGYNRSFDPTPPVATGNLAMDTDAAASSTGLVDLLSTGVKKRHTSQNAASTILHMMFGTPSGPNQSSTPAKAR